jgi:hypothetical protein
MEFKFADHPDLFLVFLLVDWSFVGSVGVVVEDLQSSGSGRGGTQQPGKPVPLLIQKSSV